MVGRLDAEDAIVPDGAKTPAAVPAPGAVGWDACAPEWRAIGALVAWQAEMIAVQRLSHNQARRLRLGAARASFELNRELLRAAWRAASPTVSHKPRKANR